MEEVKTIPIHMTILINIGIKKIQRVDPGKETQHQSEYPNGNIILDGPRNRKT